MDNEFVSTFLCLFLECVLINGVALYTFFISVEVFYYTSS